LTLERRRCGWNGGFGCSSGDISGVSSLVNTLPITKKNKHIVVTEAPKKVLLRVPLYEVCYGISPCWKCEQ